MMSSLGPRLQQIDRTYVLHRGAKLSYFGGCDYFRLSSHPAVKKVTLRAIADFGLNVAASRVTTGNHELYERLERELAEFFGVQSAVLVSSGYAANVVAAQILASRVTRVAIDEKAHSSLHDAMRFFDCPVARFPSRDFGHVKRLVRRMSASDVPLLATDGMSSQDGTVAPLRELLDALPRRGMILVDDAHAAGVLGVHGRGSIEHCGVPRNRCYQTITLSKAFGVYGGAVLGEGSLPREAAKMSRWFVGNTPLPLPFVCAAFESLGILKRDPEMRARLAANADYVKCRLEDAGCPKTDAAGPIVSVVPRNRNHAAALKRRLLARRIYPPFIRYPGGPDRGAFRFAVSSEHSRRQLDALVSALLPKSFGKLLDF